MIPIGPKNDQATNNADEHRETNPKTPKFHILFKGKVDTYWGTDDIEGNKVK